MAAGNPRLKPSLHCAAWALAATFAMGGASVAGAASAGTSDAEALHVLNRIAYGPSPGDLDHVRQVGVDRYIDEQLHPAPLPPALEQRLAASSTLDMSQRQLVVEYRELVKAAALEKKDAKDGQAVVNDGKNERRELVQRIALQAGDARLARAIQSPNQLQEVMVDFWFNHFNVFAGKGLDRVLVANYEQNAIRPYALGHFRDLLGATARHPAMLFYLDNWLSAAPGYAPPRAFGAAARPSGLNENYARELMELHTLGVDGGYSQKDVTELARMLTGWTFDARDNARLGTVGGNTFVYDDRRHDQGDKEWLGLHVASNGRGEGEWALDVLAAHPATAHHIAYELAQYFVSDDPSPALVDRLSKRFLATNGDISAVLKTLFDSPEFRSPANFGNKFKTPYQYVVSAARASSLPVTNVRPLLATLYQLGQPLYGCQTPDGYKNTEVAWLNPDAMSRRINFATALASGKLPLARPIDIDDGRGTGPAALARTADAMTINANPQWATAPVDTSQLLATLGASVSPRTRTAVADADPALRSALLLGSPDFMRR